MNGHYTIDDKDPENEEVQCWKESQVIMITEEQVVGFLDGNSQDYQNFVRNVVPRWMLA
jgi:hypothetical protein